MAQNPTALAVIDPADAALAAEAATTGDLAKLSPEKRAALYGAICRSVGLNPLTQPFGYITLNNKLTLYALKGATDQLRKVNGISIRRIEKEVVGDILMVTALAQDKTGRTDSDMGAVSIGNLRGEALANAHMKAITKAKRRVTLSIAGLGWLDESEVETIPSARTVQVNAETGEIYGEPEKWGPGTGGGFREDAPVSPPAAPQRAQQSVQVSSIENTNSAAPAATERAEGDDWQRASAHFHVVLNEHGIDEAGKRAWLRYYKKDSTKDVPAETLDLWARRIKGNPAAAKEHIEKLIAQYAEEDAAEEDGVIEAEFTEPGQQGFDPGLMPGTDEVPDPARFRG